MLLDTIEDLRGLYRAYVGSRESSEEVRAHYFAEFMRLFNRDTFTPYHHLLLDDEFLHYLFGPPSDSPLDDLHYTWDNKAIERMFDDEHGTSGGPHSFRVRESPGERTCAKQGCHQRLNAHLRAVIPFHKGFAHIINGERCARRQ